MGLEAKKYTSGKTELTEKLATRVGRKLVNNPPKGLYGRGLANWNTLSARIKGKPSFLRKSGKGVALADGRLYQIDHILAVELGGGSCLMDNLQTLCTVCHSAKTTADNRKARDLKQAHSTKGQAGV